MTSQFTHNLDTGQYFPVTMLVWAAQAVTDLYDNT